LDPETEQLISEIERLTSQALQETNQWTSIFGAGQQTTATTTTSTATSASGLVVTLDNEENKANNNDEVWTVAT
jgi:hypothetical protein